MNRYGVEDEDAEDAWITERREADKLRAEVRELKRRIAKARQVAKAQVALVTVRGGTYTANAVRLIADSHLRALATPRRKR